MFESLLNSKKDVNLKFKDQQELIKEISKIRRVIIEKETKEDELRDYIYNARGVGLLILSAHLLAWERDSKVILKIRYFNVLFSLIYYNKFTKPKKLIYYVGIF